MSIASDAQIIVTKLQQVYANLSKEDMAFTISVVEDVVSWRINATKRSLIVDFETAASCIAWLDALLGDPTASDAEFKQNRLAALETKNTAIDAEIAQLKADLGL